MLPSRTGSRILRAFGFVFAAAAATAGLSSLRAETLAYWRFDNGPVNAPVPHATPGGVFDGTTLDESGSGNHLSVWAQGGGAGFAYRTDVPFPVVPQTGTVNRFAIQNTGGSPAFFTSAADSRPAGINADTMTPARFTVEVAYKPESNLTQGQSSGFRTVLSRDARNVSSANGDLAALYLQVRPDESVGISFTDVSGFTHSAFSPPGWIYGFDFGSNPTGNNHPWYRLAAVSDGATLKMYVDNVLVASTNMAASGSPNTALAKGVTNGGDWKAGAWAVGRGLYAGGHGDRAYGFIDEVRISNSALDPNAFLGTGRPQVTKFSTDGSAATLLVKKGPAGGVGRLWQSTDLKRPIANWTLSAISSFNANGDLTFVRPITPATVSKMFFSVSADVPAPPPPPLTYSLAWGAENAPPDIRQRIVYAMDGAVALYNRWGTFRKHLTVDYHPGVPTAEANYDGYVKFGGQIGYRTAIHEIGHTMGVGTYWAWNGMFENDVWKGPAVQAQIRAFDGPGGAIRKAGVHFYPYGLNYENEGGTESNRRSVLIVAAMRKDYGIE